MKKNFLKFTYFLIFSFSLTITSFGQWSKKKNNKPPADAEIPNVKIVDNNPKNAENLHFTLLPFNCTSNGYFDVNVRIESVYRKNNQWSIGGYASKTYWLQLGEYVELESIAGISNPVEFGVEGNYFFINKKKKREYKIVLNSSYTSYNTLTHYYVPAKGKVFHYYGARVGYSLFNGSAATSYQPNLEEPYLVHASQKLTNGTFHVGLSRLTITRMKAEVEGHGEHTQKAFTYLYADLLLNTNTTFANDLVNYNGDLVTVDNWEKIPIGFRIGYKILPTKKLGYPYTIEAGMRPGPVSMALRSSKVSNSLYLSFGCGLGLGLKK